MDDSAHTTGVAFRPVETAAALWAGIVATIVVPLSPLLLGALVREGRLSLVQTGQAATAELLGIALVSALAGAALPPRGLRPIMLAAAAVAALGDLATTRSAGGAIIAVRLVCGASEGLLLWVALGLIARSRLPARVTGIYVAAQSAVALVLATALTTLLLPARGSSAGYLALAAVAGLAGPAALGLPRAYPATSGARRIAPPPRRGLLALASVFVTLAAFVGLWVYLTPVAANIGRAATLGLAVSLAIACKVGGGLTAAALARRTRWQTALAGATLAALAAMATLALPLGPVAFVLAIGVLAFLWMFLSAFQMPMVIAADPSRRSALLLSGSALLGGATGPLVVSGLIAAFGAAGALVAPLGLLALNLALIAALVATRRGDATPVIDRQLAADGIAS